MVLASHSTRLPNRTARLPTSSASVNGPEYQKPALASWGRPALQASIHSLWCPIERGSVLAGGLYSFIFDSGISRGGLDQPPQRILPLSPTNRMPLSPRLRPSSSSGGRGGSLPPSYQTILTGGRS